MAIRRASGTTEIGELVESLSREAGKTSFLLPSSAHHWAGRPGVAGAAACAHRKVSLQPGKVAGQGLLAPIIPQVAPSTAIPQRQSERSGTLHCVVGPGPPACSAPGSRSPPGGVGRRVGRWAAPPAGALDPSLQLSEPWAVLADHHRGPQAARPLHALLPGSDSADRDCLGWGCRGTPSPGPPDRDPAWPSAFGVSLRPRAEKCTVGPGLCIRASRSIMSDMFPRGLWGPAPSTAAPGRCGGTPASPRRSDFGLGGPLLAGTGAIRLCRYRGTWTLFERKELGIGH